VATRIGLQYAPPFTFLSLRFAFGLLALFPIIVLWKPVWPKSRAELGHLVVAGRLMHAAQLGGSHYAQYLGMSAGVAALIIACQPLVTAVVVQFAASLLVLAPLAVAVEGFQVRYSFQLLASIAFLVIFASILAVSVLHLLMRQGEATRVASMMYLPPVFAVVVEAAVFGVVPSGLALAGFAVTCAGVAMTVWSRRWTSPISSSGSRLP